jgi:chromate transporter
MSELSASPVSLGRIFRVFAQIGVTSFGGGIVAYLRRALVEKEKWLDEDRFMAALEISQTLPGLNSTNMSVIVGRQLRGAAGAFVAVLGMILPGAVILTGLGFAYVALRHDPKVALILTGVAAAAVGLLLQVTLKIGWKQLVRPLDLSFVLLVFVLVGLFHVSLLVILVTVAPLAVWMHRPGAKKEGL